VESVEWVHRALCKDEDPELFFPVGNTGPAASQIEAAKDVCTRCPVRLSCLEWAVQTAQDSGVWGGLTEEERRALRRARARGQRALVVVGV
jgi:WhiB family redox-sensing transcriptional regulator